MIQYICDVEGCDSALEKPSQSGPNLIWAHNPDGWAIVMYQKAQPIEDIISRRGRHIPRIKVIKRLVCPKHRLLKFKDIGNNDDDFVDDELGMIME